MTAFAGCVLLLAACSTGDDGDKAASTTTSTTSSTTTTSAPTTTLAEGETDTIASIASNPPDGYSFVDAPEGLVDEVTASLTADPETAEAITGSSTHSVVEDTTDQTIGLLMLIEIAPEYAALPGFAEGLAAGFGEGGQPTEIDGIQWTRYDDGQGGLTYLTFGKVEDGSGVMVLVLGEDAEAIEAFLAA